MCMLYNRQVTAYHAPTNHRHTIMQLCSLRLPSHCPLVLLVGFSWLLVLLLIGEWFGLATYSYCLQKRSFLFLLGFGLPSSSSGMCPLPKPQRKTRYQPWQRRLGGLCLSVRHDDHSNNCCHHHIGIALILEMYQF